MKRLNAMFKLIGLKPTIAIKFVLAVVIIVYGLYILSPFYVTSTVPGLQEFFDTWGIRTISGLIYLVPGVISLYEIIKNRANYHVSTTVGAFGMFMGFLYYVIIRFFTGSITPWTWLFPLGLAFVSAILVLTAKWHDEE